MDLANLVRRAGATLLLAMLCLVTFAQGKTVTGTVVDGTGEPLIGVSVQVKGTSTGAITDLDGKFSIPNVSPESTLVISYIGYATQEIKVGDQATFNITLADDAQLLEEVVVIGYGTMAKRDLTGSIASVSAEQLAAVPVNNVSEALTGKMPGVSASFGIRKRVGEVGVLSPYEYVMYQQELNQDGTNYGLYQDLDIWKSVEGTNYQEELFGRTGNQQQYNVSVNGGTKETKYAVSYSRNDEKSVMIGSGYARNNITVKLQTKLNKWLTLDLNDRFSYTEIDGLRTRIPVIRILLRWNVLTRLIRSRPVCRTMPMPA